MSPRSHIKVEALENLLTHVSVSPEDVLDMLREKCDPKGSYCAPFQVPTKFVTNLEPAKDGHIKVTFPDTFYDPRYKKSLIESMQRVIKNQNRKKTRLEPDGIQNTPECLNPICPPPMLSCGPPPDCSKCLVQAVHSDRPYSRSASQIQRGFPEFQSAKTLGE